MNDFVKAGAYALLVLIALAASTALTVFILSWGPQ